MRACNLHEIPEFLKDFGRLEQLNFADNQLEEIPAWLNKMPQLYALNLQRNGLAERRFKVRKNKHLEAHNLSKLQERYLPVIICLPKPRKASVSFGTGDLYLNHN